MTAPDVTRVFANDRERRELRDQYPGIKQQGAGSKTGAAVLRRAAIGT
jgi:hypothetical protein